MGWIFQTSDPMGGAAGEAYTNTLKSSGMHPGHVLAREAIQNSVDAGLEQAPKVKVRFKATVLSGDKKARFIKAAALSDIARRRQFLELSGTNCLSTLKDDSAPLNLLFVEDFHAVGLSGKPHDKNSNFYRLLLSLGDRSKGRETKGSGGSYGFGKSVYSSSSAIQTIIAYTRYNCDNGAEGRTRIFGCGYYASHEFEKEHFGGRAWLGTSAKQDKEGRQIVDPLEDASADVLAEKLGFEPRGPQDFGTSILIVDSAVDLEQIARGVEDWWWPRLIEDRLDVEIVLANGSKIIPRPNKRVDLRPFIEAYEVAIQRSEPIKGQQKYHRLNSYENIELGSCGFAVVPLTDDGPATPENRCNTVALIRAPRMVVAYHLFSNTAPPVVGAFFASDEVDDYLKKSEPPAHDKWDPDSDNLRDATGIARQAVVAVLNRVRANLRRFQNEAAPPPPPKSKRLSLLERALGAYFKPQGVGRGVPPTPVTTPLHIDFVERPQATSTNSGQLRLKAAFTVTLDDKSPDDKVDLRLKVACPVLEDDGKEGDDLPLTIECEDRECRYDKEDSTVVHFTLAKGARTKFTVKSGEYDPAWSVRLRPEVERGVEIQ